MLAREQGRQQVCLTLDLKAIQQAQSKQGENPKASKCCSLCNRPPVLSFRLPMPDGLIDKAVFR